MPPLWSVLFPPYEPLIQTLRSSWIWNRCLKGSPVLFRKNDEKSLAQPKSHPFPVCVPLWVLAPPPPSSRNNLVKSTGRTRTPTCLIMWVFFLANGCLASRRERAWEGGSASPAPGAGGGTGEEEDAVGAAPFGVTSLRVRVPESQSQWDCR